MPDIILPELSPINPNIRNKLVRDCNTINPDYILHYIETGEITFADLPDLQEPRLSDLKNRYEQWLNQPNPEEINEAEALTAAINDGFLGDDVKLQRIAAFVEKYPRSSKNAEFKEAAQKLVDKVWQQVKNIPESQAKYRAINDLIDKYSAYISTATRFQIDAEKRRIEDDLANEEIGQIRYSYRELVRFIREQRLGTPQFMLADRYAWECVLRDLSRDSLNRFINDLPQSNYVNEAKKVLDEMTTCDGFNKDPENEIFQVNEWLNDHADSSLYEMMKARLDALVDAEFERMEENPSAYPYGRFLGLINAGIITEDQLIEKGLATDSSIECANRKQDFIREHPLDGIQYVPSELLDGDDITDVFFFGVPSTGKTCVIMGLLGAPNFEWNSRIAHGKYGEALHEYLQNMTLPPRTKGTQFYHIHGTITDQNQRAHRINVFELAGEDFLNKIAKNPDGKLCLEDMGSQISEVMGNNHHKIFFLVVDPTVTRIPVENIRRDGSTYQSSISQANVIRGMVDILNDPANAHIMRLVDALHIISTKDDVLIMQNVDIHDRLHPYQSSFNTLLRMCQPKKHQINEATGFEPRAFRFSLGRFYVGGTFDYDDSTSVMLNDVIAANTLAVRDPFFIETIIDSLLNFKLF